VLLLLHHLHEGEVRVVEVRGHVLPVLAQVRQVLLQIPLLRQPQAWFAQMHIRPRKARAQRRIKAALAQLHPGARVALVGATKFARGVEEGDGHVQGKIRLAPHRLRPPHPLAGQYVVGEVEQERVLVGVAQASDQPMEDGLLDAAVAFPCTGRCCCLLAPPAVLARQPRRSRRLHLMLLLRPLDALEEGAQGSLFEWDG